MAQIYASKTNEIQKYETEHENEVRHLAGECMVLLENDGVLPFSDKIKKIALYGTGARHTVKGGTGSGDVNVRKTVSIARGLEEAGFEIVTEDWLDRYDRDLEEAQKTYLKKLKDMSDETGEPSVILGFKHPFQEPEQPIVEETDIKEADAAIYVLARNSGEGKDRRAEKGDYYLTWGAAGVPKQGERYSGDNYSFCERGSCQVMFSLCDGMGSGAVAGQESRRIVELLEALLEAGFAPRSAFKLVNTVLLLAGGEQHPAALDAGCIDLYTGALEVFKLGAAPTFVMGEEGIQVLKAGQVPAGALGQAEPVLLSQKLWDGDRLVMVTDGVLDALPGEDKEQVMGQFLESLEEMPPQDMAERILEFALSFVPGARDDMTVLTAQVWKR